MATSCRSPKTARNQGPVADDGARSPNRDEATSSHEQPKPAAPGRAVKAGAVAAAEQQRAAGKVVPLSPETPASDGTDLVWGQSGDRLTTAQGLRVDDADNSLKAGERGPTLLEDFHLREKIMHFDHERIPERVVHARGAGAHGVFEADRRARATSARPRSCARAPTTPVFVRFSTVAGSRGSADTARDVRGFATKFYTDEGNFDLVGNNIPVFFIQDGIKFPDLIHAVKPEPDREIPQAQSAHDTFWDFVSPAARVDPHADVGDVGPGHPTVATPPWRASASTRSASSPPTARPSLVKFHWKPVAGRRTASCGRSRRSSAASTPTSTAATCTRASRPGNLPQWELGVQVMPDTEDQTFEGIDLLDPTKLVPEELCPVRLVGTLTLDRNPANYFAETEQVAFHPGHLVPGHRLRRRPAAARAPVLVPRHAAHPPRWAELRADPDQPPAGAGQRQQP